MLVKELILQDNYGNKNFTMERFIIGPIFVNSLRPASFFFFLLDDKRQGKGQETMRA